MSDELSPNTRGCISILWFIAGTLVIQSYIHNRNKKSTSDSLPIHESKVSSASPAKIPSDKYEAPIRAHQHEKKMNERLFTSSNEDEEDNVERTKVVVRVPATSANLGPGFDTIGIALGMTVN